MNIKYTFVAFALSMALAADAADSELKYIPEIHGTLRTRYEYSVDDGDMRFQVRNARVGVQGFLSPVFDYKAEIDLYDRGSVKPLDVWGRVALSHQFKAQLGNMRMPFTLGSARGPHQYLFANRPTTDKHACSPRNVGLKLIYGPGSIPLSIEGGVFNATSNSNQQVWQQRMASAAKVGYTVHDLSILAGFQTLAPGAVRMNHLSGALSWQTSTWLLEGEYVYKHYAGNAARNSHAYNFMTNYGMPVEAGCFNRLSFQCRWDGTTAYSEGINFDDSGRWLVMSPGFNRLTAGVTLSYLCAKTRCDVRLNYENYFYHTGAIVSDNDRNKLVAELVVRF